MDQKKTIKAILVILMLGLSFTLQAQHLHPGTLKRAAKLSLSPTLNEEGIGIASSENWQYKTFIRMRDHATIDELLILLKNRNPVVRTYAAWALADKHYPQIYKVFQPFLTDPATISVFSGCEVIEYSTAEELYHQASYGLSDVYFKNDFDSARVHAAGLYYTEQIPRMDSVIFTYFIKKPLLEKTSYWGHSFLSAFRFNHADPSNYNKIRIYAMGKNRDAIRELGKYRRQEDISQIKLLGEEAFAAVEEFPDTAFWPFLQTYKDSTHSFPGEYFSAVAAYKNEEALKLLKDVYNDLHFTKMPELAKAVDKHYDSIYDELILKLWLEQNVITPETVNRLIESGEEKSYAVFAQGLTDTIPDRFVCTNEWYEKDEHMLGAMLSTIAKYDKEKLGLIVRRNIPYASFCILKTYMDFIEFDETYRGILLERLKKGYTGPEIDHKIFGLLLSLKDAELNEQLRIIYNDKIREWHYNYSGVDFRGLFRKYGINI